MEGVIKRLNDRGYGFIGREGEEKDLFFHSNSLIDVDFNSLREGDKVEFEVEQSEKGPNAVKVKKLQVSKVKNQNSRDSSRGYFGSKCIQFRTF